MSAVIKKQPVSVDPGSIEILTWQSARRLEDPRERDDASVEGGLVFTVENGTALDPERVTRCFCQTVKEPMPPPIRVHDRRHSHTTLALQAGIHPKVVSERVGHADISITLDPYSHAVAAMQAEEAAPTAGLVFSCP